MSYIGPLLGALGQLGGGALAAQQGKTDPSDIISSYYNPALDYALQASQYDALSQIGWGNLGSIPDPWSQVAGQLQNAPMDAKTRRRAMVALNFIKQDPSLLQDPYGAQFTRDQIFNANKTGEVPYGRVVTRGPEGGSIFGTGKPGQAWDALHFGQSDSPFAFGGEPAGKWIAKNVFGASEDTDPNGLPVANIGRLEQALGAAGMSLSDLAKKVQEQKDFEAKIARFKAAGLPQLAEQMVIDRAKTTAAASGIAAAGADYAKSGDPNANPLFQQLQAQDSRNMDRFATRAGLQANFGGISQAAAQKQISDAQLDQNLRVLQNALTTSGLLQATMAPGTQAAQGTSSGQLNSAQLAAQQAAAANQLRQGNNQYIGDSLGNAVGSATSSLGTYLSNQSLQKQLGLNKSFYGGGYGPGSTENQNATQNAMFGW